MLTCSMICCTAIKYVLPPSRILSRGDLVSTFILVDTNKEALDMLTCLMICCTAIKYVYHLPEFFLEGTF